MQHVGQHHVAGIAQRAGHLGGRIDAANVDADIFAVVGVEFVERGGRLLAVEIVPRHLDGVKNLLVAGAAADVAAEPFLDLLAVGLRVEAKCRGRGHHHAGNTVAALAGAGL